MNRIIAVTIFSFALALGCTQERKLETTGSNYQVKITQEDDTWEGQPVRLRAEIQGLKDQDILTYYWDFGDGQSEKGKGITTHTYQNDRTYKVTVTATDDKGISRRGTTFVNIWNAPPIIHIAEATVHTRPGSPVNIGAEISDPGAEDSLTVEWDVDFDGNQFSADLTGDNLNYTWAEAGTYTVAVRATDDNRASSMSVVTVIARNDN